MKTKLAHLGWDISFQKQELGLCIIYLFSKLNSGEIRQHQILMLLNFFPQKIDLDRPTT